MNNFIQEESTYKTSRHPASLLITLNKTGWAVIKVKRTKKKKTMGMFRYRLLLKTKN